jgi:hypothetical protein
MPDNYKSGIYGESYYHHTLWDLLQNLITLIMELIVFSYDWLKPNHCSVIGDHWICLKQNFTLKITNFYMIGSCDST